MKSLQIPGNKKSPSISIIFIETWGTYILTRYHSISYWAFTRMHSFSDNGGNRQCLLNGCAFFSMLLRGEFGKFLDTASHLPAVLCAPSSLLLFLFDAF